MDISENSTVKSRSVELVLECINCNIIVTAIYKAVKIKEIATFDNCGNRILTEDFVRKTINRKVSKTVKPDFSG